MNLRHVEYFLAVVDHGGMLKAAQACYIAQPSLSQAIHKLEDDLGVELFTRSGRSLALTPDGELFLAAARQLTAEVAAAQEKMKAVREGRAGWLNIAATDTLAIDPLTGILRRLLKAAPRIVVNVTEPGDSAQVVSTVRRGDCELGLIDLSVPAENLIVFELGDEEFVLAATPDLLAGFGDPVALAGPGEIPLITEPAVRRLMPEANRVLRLSVQSSHRHAIWQLVMAGVGATLLSRPLAEHLITGVETRRTDPPITRRIGIVARPEALSALARILLRVASASSLGSAGASRDGRAHPGQKRAGRGDEQGLRV